MADYYSEKLSGQRLYECYQLASPRVEQYLQAEIDFVLEHVRPTDTVLELGCGYGRVLRPLAPAAGEVIGLDSALGSLLWRPPGVSRMQNISLVCADVGSLPFAKESFDLVVGIQNGISAFHIDPVRLLKESLSVLKKGGTVLFSTYAEAFWEDRLDWFRAQASAGLLGEIDEERTGAGQIVCHDGFTAFTYSQKQFEQLAGGLGLSVSLVEIDRSALFCVIKA